MEIIIIVVIVIYLYINQHRVSCSCSSLSLDSGGGSIKYNVYRNKNNISNLVNQSGIIIYFNINISLLCHTHYITYEGFFYSEYTS